MKLIFLHGPAACGKLTIAKDIAARTGFALFHNHLVVDALLAVFPFGSPDFVRLREDFWMATLIAAARTGRSTIFTFAPEDSVAPDFPDRLRAAIEAEGGTVDFVRLTVSIAAQEARIDAASRAAFAKLRSLELLRELRPRFRACEDAMPPSALCLDTSDLPPEEAAGKIIEALRLGPS